MICYEFNAVGEQTTVSIYWKIIEYRLREKLGTEKTVERFFVNLFIQESPFH